MLIRKDNRLDRQLKDCQAALKICGYDEAGASDPTEQEIKKRLICFLNCLEKSKPDSIYRDTLQCGRTYHYGYVRDLFAMKGCLMREELPKALHYAEELTAVLGYALFQKRVMYGIIMTLKPYEEAWRNEIFSEKEAKRGV